MDMKDIKGIGKSLFRTDEEQLRYTSVRLSCHLQGSVAALGRHKWSENILRFDRKIKMSVALNSLSPSRNFVPTLDLSAPYCTSISSARFDHCVPQPRNDKRQ
ncbi:hypothetical protein PV328_007831 [Microctonus aethiopoides]|uniref:Uncharacterized protein n=1 Tax=Microctonus aethiopoides TaxID=144406 RepID=A0AA39C9K8_9HYME|nr:hypothetical protein PV328_007831 [Microctonus aethiopoides]